MLAFQYCDQMPQIITLWRGKVYSGPHNGQCLWTCDKHSMRSICNKKLLTSWRQGSEGRASPPGHAPCDLTSSHGAPPPRSPASSPCATGWGPILTTREPLRNTHPNHNSNAPEKTLSFSLGPLVIKAQTHPENAQYLHSRFSLENTILHCSPTH